MKSLADDLSADLHATSNPRHRQTRSLHQATNRKTLLRYEENPLAHAESLKDSDLGSYRFRIGDYRIIFDLQGKKIVVLRVGHRGEIYKR
ncbi:hypothetical protein DNFV4_00367 [Nitrospira tepida]|uniref:Type II toxin-antitoxin system RelE/ParE family toxin n=1 Tax=Nitrospira tepida TaxID=2973512 RepID=A0AA86T419_9BACT|nr:hypothetical protein DNFV4_00367 [Nitrospira tepida]